MSSTINTLKQLLRDASDTCNNWAGANLVVRPDYDRPAANDLSYGTTGANTARLNAKKGAIAA